MLDWFSVGQGVGVFASGVLGAMVMTTYRALRAWQSRRAHDLSRGLDVDQGISEVLRGLRDRTRAARVQLSRFHNGAAFFDGSPIKRFTCTQEEVAPGISREVLNQQNLPTSLFTALIKRMLENDATVLSCCDLADGHTRHYLESTGVGHLAVVPVYKNKLIVAFITMHFTANYPPTPAACCELLNARALVEVELARKS